MSQSNIIIADYKYFDILNSRYDILQFSDLFIGQRFRYENEWRLKVSNVLSKHFDASSGYNYLAVKPKSFVLSFKDEPLYQQ